MKKYFLFGIPIAIIVALNIIYGSIISWFLSIAIIACLIFYVAKIGLENIINRRLQQYKQGDERIGKMVAFNNKWRSVLNFLLLTIVFISGTFAMYFTMNPQGKSPWFLNNEYHGLSNSGIVFNQQLKVVPSVKDSNNANAAILIRDAGNQTAQLTFQNFFEPVIQQNEEEEGTLLNNIYSEKITNQFTIRDAKNTLAVSIEETENNFFKRLFGAPERSVIYKINLQSSDQEILQQYNLSAPFSDIIEIEGIALEKGMSLFNLFLDSDNFTSGKNETYQVLESILLQLGNTYLLVHHEGEQKSLKLFPGREMIRNGYQFLINNQTIQPKTSNTITIPYEANFFIGFANSKRLLHVAAVDKSTYGSTAKGNTALVFDFANTFMLKSPGIQEKGDKNIRFITNNFDRIITDNLKEGFHFNTYNLNVEEVVDGSIDYISGGANTPLAIAVTDNNRSGKHQVITNQKFSLSSANGNISYLFDLRDFSQNGFSPDNSVLYLGIIYIAFVVLSIFFPGKKIDRLEPIILTTIFVMTALRFILYWRIATFPPLENITKHELENTLINFDFNLWGQLPIPLTLIWVLLFVIGLIVYRLAFRNGINVSKLIKVSDSRSLIKTYALFIAACLVLYFINRRITHIEIITRFITIIIPLVGYWYFSKKSNEVFQYKPLSIEGTRSNLIIQLKAYLFYFFNNPTFIITALTILFYAICDRGFAILFTLFILLKNIFVNFLKKPLDKSDNSLKRMLYKPNNYWIYGFVALLIYLVILSFKPLFYYLLTYKLIVVLVLFILATVIIYILRPKNKKWITIAAVSAAVWAVLIAIPFSRNAIDHQMNEVVKHVQYRASLIHQPISQLLQENEYASFKTRKIIETAENQWFINSYISKDYDNDNTINLRPNSRIGVDYSTQTRDVILARYVISELGNFVMYLILVLLLLPMILYLMSYRFHLVPTTKYKEKDVHSYAGLIPLIIVFTLGLFVWLTSTNRFVFFGQDFPFLSLTSKVSVILPLILFALTLTQLPTLQHSLKINLQSNAIKYLFFTALIAAFALTTVRKNELNNKNFSVVMNTTKKHIDVDLNAILTSIQDSLDNKNTKFTYAQLINILSKDEQFDSLRNNVVQDRYTKSILTQLVEKPSTAFQLNNPLFMIYDDGRYSALYNKNLYLELPPVESRKIWNGNISESLLFNNVTTALLNYNKESKNVVLPFFVNDPANNIQFALLPGSWFAHNSENIGIVNVNNSAKSRSKIFVYKNVKKNIEQNATSFVSTLNSEDLATIFMGDKSFPLSFRNSGNRFALNKWINGEYKIVYPLKEHNFWIYNFANAIRTAYSNDLQLTKNLDITLDYELGKEVQIAIDATSKAISTKNRKYNFSVIAADGDGNVRLMSDFVTNRNILDPNNSYAIYNLQRQQFFFSNARNERDQWGNRNLLNLYLGPGSSIKPLTTGVIASQLNAGWERLLLNNMSASEELENYAGLKLVKKWKNDEHYFGEFGIPKFLEFSSNYYQSVMMFLGSFSRDYYFNENKYSLANLLSPNAGANNTFPVLSFNGARVYLPNLDARKGNWPATDKNKTNKSYFGNENSLIALGFEQNANLRTKDKDKNDQQLTTVDRVNFVDTALYNVLNKNQSGGYLWSFPEQSYFLQSERAFNEIHQNFNLGLKTATLGGYPYRLTPYMMLQMYLGLFAQNKNFGLHIIKEQRPKSHWQVDSTWGNAGAFNAFMAYNVFKGMNDVIYGPNGTAKRLSALKAAHGNLFFYAKTGTINEQTSNLKSSRRLVIIASNKELQDAVNIGSAKLYAWYFTVDNTGDFDWNLLMQIMEKTMASKSFTYYFNQP